MYVIACGHGLTASAAKEIMDSGGNAFDGIIAASFASTVVEPMLTTLAGGGIGLLHSPSGETKAVDFLTNFPTAESPASAIKDVVSFRGENQVFYLGYGSIGVPGTLDGLLHIHRNHCTMELDKLLAPAIRFAKGHKMSSFQEFVCYGVLKNFVSYTEGSREVFLPHGRPIKEGEPIRNLKLAAFLEMLSSDENEAIGFYHEAVSKTLEGKQSSLSPDDLKSYKVFEREPISIDYRSYNVSLAPPPSAGGLLIAHGLKFLEQRNPGHYQHNSYDHVELLIEMTKECDSRRTSGFFKNLLYKEGFWKQFLKKDNFGGTTHISITDSDGNAATITASNGQGCGVMAGDTGIMLNNFAAEPDLMQYRELYTPGERITSMMTPTVITRDGKLSAVLGSGGSSRIRSAITQVISNMIDFNMEPQAATNASRVHFEGDLLQLEPGIDPEKLAGKYNCNVWKESNNFFFGGVHIAAMDKGGGDPRRSGTVVLGR